MKNIFLLSAYIISGVILVISDFFHPAWAQNQNINSRGVVRAITRAMIPVQVDGVVSSVNFRVGDFVKKGDLMVELDCRVANSNKVKADAAFRAAEVRANSNRGLAALSSVSQIELASAVAEADQRRAEAQIAEINAENCQIFAPFDGVINQVLVSASEMIINGRPLLELVSLSKIEIEANIEVAAAVRLKPNEIVHFQLDNEAEPIKAKIVVVGSVVDPVSQTVIVRAIPDHIPALLLPGRTGSLIY